MKTVTIKIPNNKTKRDYVKIECEDVVYMEKEIEVLSEWIENLNKTHEELVTDEAYEAIFYLTGFLESYKRL
jgi:hypothetical protein